MDYQALFARILQTVDEQAYFTPSLQVDARQRAAVEEIERRIQAPDFDATQVRAYIRQAHADGRIDRVMMLSALHVVAASPRVKDWDEAARLVGEQEFAALELGGPNLNANLASVDRHRGVLAYLRGHHGVALDYFTRALERERSAENLGNAMCALLSLGEEDEARELLVHVRQHLSTSVVQDLERQIARDPDLALLRSEVA